MGCNCPSQLSCRDLHPAGWPENILSQRAPDFSQHSLQCWDRGELSNSGLLAVAACLVLGERERWRGQCSHCRQLCSDCWHRSQYPLTLRAQLWPGWRLAGCWLVRCRARVNSQHVRHHNQPTDGLTPLAGPGGPMG